MPPSSAPPAAGPSLPTLGMRQVFGNLVRQARDGQRLQPDCPGALQHGQENSVPAEDHVLDARHRGDLECRPTPGTRPRGPDARAALSPGARFFTISSPDSSSHAVPWPPTFCSRKPSPPKMPAPSDCWKPTPMVTCGVAQRNPCRWTMYSAARADLDRHNVPRHLGGKRDLAGILHRRGTRS